MAEHDIEMRPTGEDGESAQDDDDADVHRCGKCKLDFTNIQEFIRHKLDKDNCKIKYMSKHRRVLLPHLVKRPIKTEVVVPPPPQEDDGAKENATENQPVKRKRGRPRNSKQKRSHIQLDAIIERSNYDCLKCQKSFHRAATLRRHMEMIHDAVILSDEEDGFAALQDDDLRVDTNDAEFTAAGVVNPSSQGVQIIRAGDDTLVEDVTGTPEASSLEAIAQALETLQSVTVPEVDEQGSSGDGSVNVVHRTEGQNLVEAALMQAKIIEMAPPTAAEIRAIRPKIEPSERLQECNICKRRFKELAVLRAHMLTHSDKREFHCPFHGCPYAFKTKGSLKRHVRRHTDERPYKCYLCNRSFRESGALTRHMKSRTPCIAKTDADLPRYGRLQKFYRYPNDHLNCVDNGVQDPEAGIPDDEDSSQGIEDGEDPSVGVPMSEMEIGDDILDQSQLYDVAQRLESQSTVELKCLACGLELPSHLRFKRHLQLHIEELPLQCGLCVFAAETCRQLNEHMKSSHSADPQTNLPSDVGNTQKDNKELPQQISLHEYGIPAHQGVGEVQASGAHHDSGGAQLGGSESGGAQLGGSESEEVQLRGYQSGEAQLGEFESEGAQLGGSESGGAQLGESQSGGAQLGESQSGGAQLGGSESGGAQLGGSESGGAQLGESESGGAQLGGFESEGAQLEGSESGGAQLGGSESGGTQLGGSESGGVQLGGSESGGAQLGGSESGGTQVGGSESGGIQLGGSDGVGAQLEGSESRGVQLGGSESTQAQLEVLEDGVSVAQLTEQKNEVVQLVGFDGGGSQLRGPEDGDVHQRDGGGEEAQLVVPEGTDMPTMTSLPTEVSVHQIVTQTEELPYAMSRPMPNSVENTVHLIITKVAEHEQDEVPSAGGLPENDDSTNEQHGEENSLNENVQVQQNIDHMEVDPQPSTSQDGGTDTSAEEDLLKKKASQAMEQIIKLGYHTTFRCLEVDKDLVQKYKHHKKCPYCGRMFRGTSYLRLHMRIHTGERPHKCSHCLKGFTTRDALNKHLYCHTDDRQYKCGECGKMFKRISHVREHIKIHTGERPFVCQFCGKGFKTHNACKVHTRIHTNIIPWQCHACKKCFREKGSLERHVRTHTGEKPYSCNHCGRKFSEHGTLNRHLKAKVPCTRSLFEQRGMYREEQGQEKTTDEYSTVLAEFSSVVADTQYIIPTSGEQTEHESREVVGLIMGTEELQAEEGGNIIEIIADESNQIINEDGTTAYVILNQDGDNITVLDSKTGETLQLIQRAEDDAGNVIQVSSSLDENHQYVTVATDQTIDETVLQHVQGEVLTSEGVTEDQINEAIAIVTEQPIALSSCDLREAIEHVGDIEAVAMVPTCSVDSVGTISVDHVSFSSSS